MKKLIIFLGCILLISTVTNGQYKINKTKYDFRSYKRELGDPYNPSVAGLASFMIPGLGQMASGEGKRGAAFFGGWAGFFALFIVGNNTGSSDKAINRMFIGFLGMLSVDIFSCVDATRVAKVNNLAFRDKNKTGFNLEVSPYLEMLHTENSIVGLSLRAKF